MAEKLPSITAWECAERERLDGLYLPRLWPHQEPSWTKTKIMSEIRASPWVTQEKMCKKDFRWRRSLVPQHCLVSIENLQCFHGAPWIKGSFSPLIKHKPTNTNFALRVISVCPLFRMTFVNRAGLYSATLAILVCLSWCLFSSRNKGLTL